jgi:uncharacterized small protein (DUF1192 family)
MASQRQDSDKTARSLPLAEAAQLLGVSQRTLLRRIEAGDVKAKKHLLDGHTHWLVEVADDMPRHATGMTDHDNVTAELHEEIADLKDEVSLLKSQLTEKDKQIEQLHILLGRSQPRQLEEATGKRWWSSLLFWKR